ncbi:hypothetical protein I546_1416 [Mycobacterium kansasii 732]|nr:hypothetical protein I546_1416 [Mycobacterium kansasii 732]
MDLDDAVSTVALVSATTRDFSLSSLSVGDPPHQAGAD